MAQSGPPNPARRARSLQPECTEHVILATVNPLPPSMLSAMLVLVSKMRLRSIPKICHNTNMNVAYSEMKSPRLHASSEIQAIPLCPRARLWSSHLVGHPAGKQHAAMGQRRWHWPPGQLALGTGSVLIPLSGHSTSARAETYADRDGTRQALEQA